MILSSFYWGYVLTQVPGGLLAEKFGGKHTLGLGILSTAIFTLLTPIAVARGGPTALIVLRILMGLGEGTTFPSMNHLVAQWAPPSERSKIGSLVFAGTVAGTVTGNALSGILIHSYGWTSVFYFFGSLGVIWFTVFSLVCYSSPYEHPFISAKEKKYLTDSMSVHTHRNIPPTPWKHIFKSIPLWALTVAFVGQDWGTFTLTSDLPKYMHSVLKFSVKANGILSALPSLFMWLVSMLSSWIADWMINRDFMSRTNVRRMFTTVGFMGAAIFIISASYAGCNRTLVVILFVIAMATNGTVYPGMKVNALDLSPNYSGTILALANGIGALSGIATPYVVGVLTPDQTAEEWRIVFWIVFVFYAITNLIYLLYASGDVQKWNDPDFLIKSKLDQESNKGCNNANNKQTPISNYQLRRLSVH
ncbi:putative inorganic phosphate cotransporter isoform X2 [Athalia rosae]|nr:putative inorganic phosphate cotransporter isoform X2 [Athalia rosae]